MLAEIAAMNNVLFGFNGVLRPSHSVPCSQMQVGGADYVRALWNTPHRGRRFIFPNPGLRRPFETSRRVRAVPLSEALIVRSNAYH